MVDILIVGEAFGSREAELGIPFAGPAGSVLNGMLRQIGVDRDACLITDVFNFQPPSGIDSLMTKEQKFAAEGWPTYAPKTWVHRAHALSLHDLTELRKSAAPNVILALGDVALWALTHQRGIKKKRGAPLMTFDGLHKVIPTWHPSSILKQWELRAVALLDMQKAKRESAFPELRRPERHIIIEPSIADIYDFYLHHVRSAPVISVDVETKMGQITEVGIAVSRNLALVIPFWHRAAKDGNYWPDARSERQAWELIRKMLAERPTIGQNFQYDMTYFYKTLGIKCPMFAGDTMLLHHAMQPELEKGLGFLGSIYTNEPAWKFMRLEAENATLKKED